MAFEAQNRQLFGLDLRSLPRALRRGWEEARQWPAFSWLSPQEPVRVLLPDGSQTVRQGASAEPAAPGARPRAVALVLPDSAVLVRRLFLPPLTEDEVREALALEVAAVSPFPPGETVWGWQAQMRADRLVVRLALAARGHVAAHLERSRERLQGVQPEVWAEAQAPIVLEGFGERARAQRRAREGSHLALALATAALLVLALAATPVLQTRLRLLEAQDRYAALEAETAQIVAAYGELAKATGQARAIQAHLHERPNVLHLVDTLTTAVPDEAYLTRLEVHGRQVRMTGQADNASRLMELLSARGAEFRDLRAPFPISRAAGAEKESFTIEFVLADGEAGP